MIVVATKLSMDEGLVEATWTNAATREKVIALLNSMTLDPLPYFLDSSNLQITKLIASYLIELCWCEQEHIYSRWEM